MRATDLRIWNYVKADLYNDRFILIESICSKNNDIFNSTTGEIPLTSLNSIELTEEILLKCGFNTTFEKITEIQINEDEVLYYDIAEKCMSLYVPIHYEDTSLVFRHCKYLHQLQNLYWCLCGKELTINL